MYYECNSFEIASNSMEEWYGRVLEQVLLFASQVRGIYRFELKAS